MFQLSLFTALLAPALAPTHAPTFSPAPTPCTAELSRALSNDAPGVVLFGDLHSHLFGDEAGQWAHFLRDERWFQKLHSAAEADGEGAELREWLDAAHAAMQGLRGGAFALDAFGTTAGSFNGVLSVDKGWFESMQARVADSARETTCLGRPALAGPTNGAGEKMLLVNGGAHVFFALGSDIETASRTVEAMITALEAGTDTTERWWLASDARVAGATLELFVNLGATMPADERAELEATMGAMGVTYGAFLLGAGPEAEMRSSIDFAGGPILDALASSFVAADTALFGFVPSGYTGTIVGLDVLAAIDELLVFAEQTTPDARANYDQGLEALAGLLGVDLEADLLGHLTGQVLLLQPETDFAVFAKLEEDPAALAGILPVFGFGIEDVDAVVGTLEAIVEAATAQGLVAETAEIAGGSLWTFDPGTGMTIAVAAGSGFLAIGTEQGVTDLLAVAAKPSEVRAAATKELAAATRQLDGCLVTAAPMSTVLESLTALSDLIATVGEGQEGAAEAREFAATAAKIAPDHLSGVMAGELSFTAKRFSYRILSR